MNQKIKLLIERISSIKTHVTMLLPGRHPCFSSLTFPINAFFSEWQSCWYSRPSKPLSLHHLISLVNECQSAAPHTIWQQISSCSRCLSIPRVPSVCHSGVKQSSLSLWQKRQMFGMLFTVTIRDSHVRTETSPFFLFPPTKPCRINYRWWNNL